MHTFKQTLAHEWTAKNAANTGKCGTSTWTFTVRDALFLTTLPLEDWRLPQQSCSQLAAESSKAVDGVATTRWNIFHGCRACETYLLSSSHPQLFWSPAQQHPTDADGFRSHKRNIQKKKSSGRIGIELLGKTSPIGQLCQGQETTQDET